ncbi:MAG: GNAT family N-acetyltransferase [Acidobacteria bacterium]|nr:GNAT family N-acetyltransferase [Acidobacteriota bacterium]
MTSTRARVTLTDATKKDVAAIVALQTATAQRLTADFGNGHWSHLPTERGVLQSMRESRVFVARGPSGIIATLRLTTKKPWAIERSYFTVVSRPLYLLDMAVDVTMQREGIGRQCMEEAARIAREWPGDAIRLDAYDSPAGAGPFYAKCGYQPKGAVTYRIVPLLYYELLL